MHHTTKPTLVYLLPIKAAPIEIAKPKIKKYPDTGYELDLDWARTLVGFEYFDSRYLPKIGRLFLDDNGLAVPNATPNKLATQLYVEAGYSAGNVVVGDCILVVEPGRESQVRSTMEDLMKAG